MIPLAMIKVGNNLVAPGPMEQQELDRFADGEMIVVSLVKGRSPAFLSKFWTMIRWAYRNIEHEQPSEEMLKEDLMIMAGLAHKTIGLNGEIYYSPLRINFADMADDQEFSRVYEAVLDVLVKIVGTDKQKLNNLIGTYG